VTDERGGRDEREDRDGHEARGEPRRRRQMSRIGDLIPEAAARLGLAEELRRARATATFDAIVAERAPAAHGACRALRIDGTALVVEADAPIVAQELRIHATELATAFHAAPAGTAITEIRVTIRKP
jgi:Dna[CI] antecedent, DciA